MRTLSNRVAELEDALAANQGQGSSSRTLHLHRDHHHDRDDESMQDFEDSSQPTTVGAAADGLGSLKIGEQGQTKFHGLTTASEVLFFDLTILSELCLYSHCSSSKNYRR